MKLITEQQQDLITAVRNIAPQARIAGGFARDVYYGVTPNDIDLIVPTTYDSTNLQDLDYFLSKFTQLMGENNAHYVNSKLVSVYNHVGVDILVFDHSAGTLLDIVQDEFDCNINHFVYNQSVQEAQFVGKNMGKLQFTQNYSLTSRRTQYMQDKAEELGWVV